MSLIWSWFFWNSSLEIACCERESHRKSWEKGGLEQEVEALEQSIPEVKDSYGGGVGGGHSSFQINRPTLKGTCGKLHGSFSSWPFPFTRTIAKLFKTIIVLSMCTGSLRVGVSLRATATSFQFTKACPLPLQHKRQRKASTYSFRKRFVDPTPDKAWWPWWGGHRDVCRKQ